jgi:rhamnose transport system ATP-binding protein
MYRLASRVTVFRDAHYIGTYNVSEIKPPELIKAMVGREIKDLFPKPSIVPGKEVLRVEHLSRTGFFKDVSFNIHAGEIVGLTGLVGAGRTEVVQTIFGIEKYNEGKIFVDNKEVHITKPRDAMNLGVGLLTEDRQTQGLILSWGIGRNITLPEISQFASKGITNENQESLESKKYAEKVAVKAVTVFDPASSLSGGNQQKVVVAKALTSDLKLLIMDEPTKGVDVGAKAQIYEIIGDLAKQGMAVLMISSEMPEILGMCDRIYVMCDGRITGELPVKDASQEKILELAMTKHSAVSA